MSAIARLGAEKTLLARAMPAILPELSIEEALDVKRS
jgi:predicted ATPase with chaperone activity